MLYLNLKGYVFSILLNLNKSCINLKERGEKMKVYELTVTYYLKEDLYFTKANEYISKLLNRAFLLDEQLKYQHSQKGYKFYCFSSFYPIEPEKTYKAGKVYVFTIRTLHESWANKMQRLLPKVKHNGKVLAVECKKRVLGHIESLYTLTPALITVDNGRYWVPGDDFKLFEDQFNTNACKKYKAFYGKELQPINSFIQSIQMVSKKPISYHYKQTKLLGNKFNIIVNEDEISQKLAKVIIGCGLGEKNSSVGMGMVNYQYVR